MNNVINVLFCFYKIFTLRCIFILENEIFEFCEHVSLEIKWFSFFFKVFF